MGDNSALLNVIKRLPEPSYDPSCGGSCTGLCFAACSSGCTSCSGTCTGSSVSSNGCSHSCNHTCDSDNVSMDGTLNEIHRKEFTSNVTRLSTYLIENSIIGQFSNPSEDNRFSTTLTINDGVKYSIDYDTDVDTVIESIECHHRNQPRVTNNYDIFIGYEYT